MQRGPARFLVLVTLGLTAAIFSLRAVLDIVIGAMGLAGIVSLDGGGGRFHGDPISVGRVLVDIAVPVLSIWAFRKLSVSPPSKP